MFHPLRRPEITLEKGLEPANPRMDQYILSQTGRANPAVCFIYPSGEATEYLLRFYSAFRKLSCRPSHLLLFNPPIGDLESFILGMDCIYVGGGNTKSMLAVWREWELDRILRRAWLEGIVLAGVSAGSMCWFEQGLTDSIPGSLNCLRCLGFLAGSNCPFYDGAAERRTVYPKLVGEGRMLPGYAAELGVGLHFIGGELRRVVSTKPLALAYYVSVESGQVSERPIQPEILE